MNMLFVALLVVAQAQTPGGPATFSQSRGSGGGGTADCQLVGGVNCQMTGEVRGDNDPLPATPSFSGSSASGNDTDGMFFPSATEVAFAVNGAQRLTINATTLAIASTLNYLAPAGTAALPSFSFTTDTDTGMFLSTTNTVGLATAGVTRFSVSTSIATSTLPFGAPAGTAAAPSFTFSADPNTGLFNTADAILFSTGGTQRLALSTTSLLSTLPFVAPVGTAAAPTYTFTGDVDNGLYLVAANRVGITTGGVARLEVSATGQLLPAATTDVEEIGSTTAAWKSIFLGSSVEGITGKALAINGPSGVTINAGGVGTLAIQTGGNSIFQQQITAATNAPVLRLPAFANTAVAAAGANLSCNSTNVGGIAVIDDSSSTSTKFCVCARVTSVYNWRAIDNLATVCSGL